MITGDLNDWNNRKSNTCGNVLEEYMHRNGLLCINDGQSTRRNSDSVIDLFLVTPRVIPEVIMCETGNLKTDLWPVQTDLEIFRPIYFASNVILSVRKKMYILVTFVIKFVETITVVVFFFHDRSKHSHVLIQYPVITHVSSH